MSMLHQIKLTDKFSVLLEAVELKPKETIGTTSPVVMRKAVFKYDEGQYNGFIAVDFMGTNAELPHMVKPGRKYMVTMEYRGRKNPTSGNVYANWQGVDIQEI